MKTAKMRMQFIILLKKLKVKAKVVLLILYAANLGHAVP